MFGFSLIRNDKAELIRALRANVSDLQRRLDRTKFHLRGVEGRVKKVREQQALDRAYLERLKGAAWAVLDAPDDDLARTVAEEALRTALSTPISPPAATVDAQVELARSETG